MKKSDEALQPVGLIAGSRGILVNTTGSASLGLHEVSGACSIIRKAAECEYVQINFGVIQNDSMRNAVKVTVVATGFQPEHVAAFERRSSGVIPRFGFSLNSSPERSLSRSSSPSPRRSRSASRSRPSRWNRSRCSTWTIWRFPRTCGTPG